MSDSETTLNCIKNIHAMASKMSDPTTQPPRPPGMGTRTSDEVEKWRALVAAMEAVWPVLKTR